MRKAFFKAAKGKRNRKDVKKVLDNVDKHVAILRGMLIREEFRPAHHRPVTINDGYKLKKRKIIKPYYKYEQVVHHAIFQVLAPSDKDIKENPSLKKVINRGFYEYTCGSLKGRGAHYGKKYIERWIRNDVKNTKYVLKIDIRHFYDSIPHDKLKAKLRRVIADEKTLRLLDLIIDAVPEGLPLGYDTSKWLADFYLQDLDHYIKQEVWKPEKERKVQNYVKRMERKGITKYKIPKYACGLPYMVRYVDDIVGFAANKRELKIALERIETFCRENLGLEIKANKQIFPLSKEIKLTEKEMEKRRKEGKSVKETVKEIGRALDFMGFLFRRTRTTIRKAILYRITRKARKLAKKEKINWYDACSMVSRMGYFKYTDAYNVYLDRVKPYVNIKRLKKIISNHERKGRVAYAAS